MPRRVSRFACVLNGEAVRDNETGLVWQQSPATTTYLWADARDACTFQTTGNRYGWRLPSVAELTSLLAPLQPGPAPGQASPALPSGHPFSNVASFYWSATTVADDTTAGGAAWAVDFNFPDVGKAAKLAAHFKAWCVRGGMNEHKY